MNAQDFLNGQVILIDKPLHWTSFQVVNKLRWAIRRQFNLKKIKVGHAGTLDPLASGLLIICTGKMTKQIETFQGQNKEYIAEITLGATTPSYDLETEIDATFSTAHITQNKIESEIAHFLGEISQKPPLFSAIKKDGKRLYELARAGKTTEIKSRKVVLYELELLKLELPKITLRVVCSKGTYIRSLAHDLGKALDSGAHLSALRRTKIGEYNVNHAKTIDDFLSELTS